MVRYTPGSTPLPHFGRRTMLRVMLAGAGVAATGGLLSACGGGSGSGGDSKVVTFGNNLSDQVPKQALQPVMARVVDVIGLGGCEENPVGAGCEEAGEQGVPPGIEGEEHAVERVLEFGQGGRPAARTSGREACCGRH